MAKVKRGKVIQVENKNKKFGANSDYYAIWVENSKGSEYCLLFTEYELNRAKDRANNNPEDVSTKGFFTDFFD